MNRRADIGVGVDGVEKTHHFSEYVFPFKDRRAELLAVWEYRVYHQRGCVCYDDVLHHFFKVFHIIYKGVDVHSDEEYIPEKVRDYKPFVEWDYIVYAAVNRIIIRRDYKSLKGIEKYAVYRPENKQFKMLVFDGVQLAQFEFAVINARFHSPTSFEMMLRLTDGFRFAFRAGHFDFAVSLWYA